jgi:hypothetical protein
VVSGAGRVLGKIPQTFLSLKIMGAGGTQGKVPEFRLVNKAYGRGAARSLKVKEAKTLNRPVRKVMILTRNAL